MFRYEELIKKNRKITPIFKVISSEAADDDEGFSFEDPNEEDTNEEDANLEDNEEESDEGFSFDTSEGDDETTDDDSEDDDFSFGDDEDGSDDDEDDDFSFGNDSDDSDSSKNNKSSVDPNEASIDTNLSELLREYVPKSISDLKVIVAKNLDIMKSCPYINDDIEYCIDKYNQAYDQMITKFIPRLSQIDDVSRLKFFVAYKSLFSKIVKAFVVSVQAERRNR